MKDPYLPQSVTIIKRIQESPHIVTLHLQFEHQYQALPGQFNMLYVYGEGEVPISVTGVERHSNSCVHTIHARGRVTEKLCALKEGDTVGVRGPFGQGWPLDLARGREVIVVSGGIGCAPTVGAIEHIMQYRNDYGAVHILYGVKNHEDILFQDQFAAWEKMPNVQVYLAAENTPAGKWHRGYVTELLAGLEIENPANVLAMMCGPEPMMFVAAEELIKKGLSSESLFLSLERNMQCGIGHCGHCQCGAKFVCKDGPVFAYPLI